MKDSKLHSKPTSVPRTAVGEVAAVRGALGVPLPGYHTRPCFLDPLHYLTGRFVPKWELSKTSVDQPKGVRLFPVQ